MNEQITLGSFSRQQLRVAPGTIRSSHKNGVKPVLIVSSVVIRTGPALRPQLQIWYIHDRELKSHSVDAVLATSTPDSVQFEP